MPVREIQLRVPSVCRPRGARDRDRGEITESIEEYVEGIWRLEREIPTVGTGEIAQYMDVAPASVTTMLKRLAELGLVEHVPYQGVRCTEKGEALAVTLLRKHRLLERLLVDFLELPWDGVHDLACKLEHYISLDVADRMERALGHPTTCPHGNPVDATATDDARRLADAAPGDRLEVVRVTDEREAFLAYLQDIGLVPGAEITLLERTPFGDVLSLDVAGQTRPVAVGIQVAASIWVAPRRAAQGGIRLHTT